MSDFKKALKKNEEKLGLYVPVVARVHGESHPEFHEVKRLYGQLMKRGKEDPKADLDKDFESLHKITDGYTVPCDVCETYEAVYQMLSELEAAYKAD